MADKEEKVTVEETEAKENKPMPFELRLAHIQRILKAPKSKYNSFGKYNYRSLEDILEAVKPLLEEYHMLLTIEDGIAQVGERFYIKATATVTDAEDTNKKISVSAFAREPLDKKGADQAQVTGASSSYARKYCLNGLFLIDDTKDPDTDEYTEQTTGRTAKKKEPQMGNPDAKINETMVKAVRARLKAAADKGKVMEESNLCKWLKIDKIEDMTMSKHNLFNKLMSEQGL